jgi:hypothetical protein
VPATTTHGRPEEHSQQLLATNKSKHAGNFTVNRLITCSQLSSGAARTRHKGSAQRLFAGAARLLSRITFPTPQTCYCRLQSSACWWLWRWLAQVGNQLFLLSAGTHHTCHPSNCSCYRLPSRCSLAIMARIAICKLAEAFMASKNRICCLLKTDWARCSITVVPLTAGNQPASDTYAVLLTAGQYQQH